MSDRCYCPGASRGGLIRLEADEAHHLVRVRRASVGDTVVCFDGEGYATRARVVVLGKQHVELEPEGPPLPDRITGLDLTLLVAFPKGERLDWLVEKATELGVSTLVPLRTERSVVDPRPAKVERLRRAVIEASKQCGRNRLMRIEPARSWAEMSGMAGGVRYLAHPSGLPLRDQPPPASGTQVVLAVGPEGGFTDGEVEAARSSGWTPIGLGPTILRIETAAIVGCAQVLMHVA